MLKIGGCMSNRHDAWIVPREVEVWTNYVALSLALKRSMLYR
jgi:hypothetical protein